jgi:lipopolysaccharide/colanic/teichoic acid biosynthesis glycosyltransferase
MTKAFDNTLMIAQLPSPSGESAHGDVRASHVSDILQYGFAAVSLLLLAPLFLIISLLIRLTSRGPVLDRGLRIGKDGHIVTIYKFSTLHAGAHGEVGVSRLSDRNASHTCVGKLLKCTKLDRLPQLVNVLKGEMNLVGPQPVRPIFLEKLSGDMPRCPTRVTVKPGMTELAAVGAGCFIDAKDTRREAFFHMKNR